MRRKRVAFVGNCQSDAIGQLYRGFVGAADSEEVRCIDDTGLDRSAVASLVQDCDMVVVQEREFNVALNADALRPGVEFHAFPMVLLPFLWPYAHEPHVRNAPEPPLPDGPYPGQLSDSFLNRLITRGVAPEAALAEYRAHDIAKAAHLDRLYELHLELQQDRDARTGFDIASLIASDFRREALFMSPHHPNARLFGVLVSQLFEKMGVPTETTALALCGLLRSPFPSGEAPIHPGVIKHFGLEYADDATDYAFHAEGRFTFDDYVLRYMRYDHNHELRKGMFLVHTGDLAGAVDSLELALVQSPQSDQGWRAKGLALHHLGRRDEATEAYRQAITVAPQDAEAHFDFAQALMFEGRLEEAEAEASKAASHAPQYGFAHLALTEIRVKRGDHDGAAAAGREALRLLPNQPGALLWSAIAFLLTGDLDAAKRNVVRAIAMQPSVADHRNVLAEILEREGRRDEAIATLQACAAEASPNAQTFSLLGNFYLRSGDDRSAFEAFEDGLKIEPDRADLKEQARGVRERLNVPA